MSGSIRFSGVGSGLDTQAIIQALLAVERLPIEQLETRKRGEQEKLKKLNEFKGLVDGLRTKSQELSTLSGFLSYSVGASTEGAATFSASGNAVAGAHSLTVQQLAAGDRWAFDAVSDPDVDLASADGQSVSFTYDGTLYTASVTAGASSLNEIAAAIKAEADAVVNVSVVNTGTEANPSYQLVIAGKDTGEDFRITGLASTVAGLTVDGTGPDPSGLALSANNIVVGSDALALVDGLQVRRSDNDFSDVVEGVSISLLKADPLNEVTFTVEPDKEAIKGRLQGFVDAYNKVSAFVRTQNTYDEENGAGGPLFGENTLRTIQGVIRKALFNQSSAQAAGDLTGYGTLRLVGIESTSDGSLKINDKVLDAKMDGDLSAFADLFVDVDGFDNGGAPVGDPAYYIDISPDTGLADDLVREIDRVVKSYQSSTGSFYKGIFDARTDSINASIKLFDKQIEDRERRLEQFELNLQQRFTALETLMAQLQSQGAYLSQNL